MPSASTIVPFFRCILDKKIINQHFIIRKCKFSQLTTLINKEIKACIAKKKCWHQLGFFFFNEVRNKSSYGIKELSHQFKACIIFIIKTTKQIESPIYHGNNSRLKLFLVKLRLKHWLILCVYKGNHHVSTVLNLVANISKGKLCCCFFHLVTENGIIWNEAWLDNSWSQY